MAKIKFSAVVSDARGKIGGNVFARNASGAYIRSFAMPVNPNTAKQQAVRTSFANLISSWKSISAVKQQLWEDMTPQYPYNNSLGEASKYTGQQLYNHLNMNLKTANATVLEVPLVPQTFTNTSVVSVEMVLTAGVLTTGEVAVVTAGSATETVIVEVTTSLSGGITKPAKGLFRKVLVQDAAAAGSDIEFLAEYIALYGSPELGAKVFCRVFLINDNTGQRVNLGQAVTIVTGT
jgi:hypothetical protein